MKHAFTILLASMLLVFILTACGRRDNNNAQTSNDPPTTNQEANTNGQHNNSTQNDAIVGDSTHQNGEIGTQNGTADNREGSTLNEPANGTTDSNAGVSYEQMLRNGRVHDTDGMLHDGENAVSDIVRGTENAVGDVVRGTENAVGDLARGTRNAVNDMTR